MRVAKAYAYADIALVIFCAAAPQQSARIAESFIRVAGLDGILGVIAFHAAAIAIVAMICSLARNYRDVAGLTNRKARLLIDVFVVIVFIYIIYQANLFRSAGAKDIGEQYILYLLSLAFCLGAGYAASDALRSIINH